MHNYNLIGTYYVTIPEINLIRRCRQKNLEHVLQYVCNMVDVVNLCSVELSLDLKLYRKRFAEQ